MHSLRLGQTLAVAVALSLTLLSAGVIVLSVGIRYGDVVGPDLDVSLSGLHIVAYTTDQIACWRYLPCPGPFSQDYYMVWVFRKTAPDYVRETGYRILAVPLQR